MAALRLPRPPGDPGLRSLSVLAGTVWLLQMLDAASALWLIGALGPSAELNPIMRHVYLATGPAGIVGVKTAVVGPIVVLLARVGRRGQRRLARAGLLAAAVLGLVGTLSNLPALPFV